MRLGGAQVTELPFGACVWATGIAMHPLVKQLQERLAPFEKCLLISMRSRDRIPMSGDKGVVQLLRRRHEPSSCPQIYRQAINRWRFFRLQWVLSGGRLA